MNSKNLHNISKIIKPGAFIVIDSKTRIEAVKSETKDCNHECYFYKNSGCEDINCEAQNRTDIDYIYFKQI